MSDSWHFPYESHFLLPLNVPLKTLCSCLVHYRNLSQLPASGLPLKDVFKGNGTAAADVLRVFRGSWGDRCFPWCKMQNMRDLKSRLDASDEVRSCFDFSPVLFWIRWQVLTAACKQKDFQISEKQRWVLNANLQTNQPHTRRVSAPVHFLCSC